MEPISRCLGPLWVDVHFNWTHLSFSHAKQRNIFTDDLVSYYCAQKQGNQWCSSKVCLAILTEAQVQVISTWFLWVVLAIPQLDFSCIFSKHYLRWLTEKHLMCLTISNIFLGIKIYLITKENDTQDHSIDKDCLLMSNSFSSCGCGWSRKAFVVRCERSLWYEELRFETDWLSIVWLQHCAMNDISLLGLKSQRGFPTFFLVRQGFWTSVPSAQSLHTWLSKIHSGLKESMNHWSANETHYCLKEKDFDVRIGA